MFSLTRSVLRVLTTAMDLLVPAYFYPGAPWSTNHWADMAASPNAARVTAIMNPKSGPGEVPDAGYQSAVVELKHAGGRVLGYVATGYATRDPAEVLAEVAQYRTFYGVDGVFLDEMANSPDKLAYYTSLYDQIKATDGSLQVVANPGLPTSSDFLRAADVLVTYEDAQGYATATQPDWAASQPPSRSANLIYGAGDADTMAQYMALAARRNVGYIYVTDAAGSNPWDTLPAYWQQELATVGNTPATTLRYATDLVGGSLDAPDWVTTIYASDAPARQGMSAASAPTVPDPTAMVNPATSGSAATPAEAVAATATSSSQPAGGETANPPSANAATSNSGNPGNTANNVAPSDTKPHAIRSSQTGMVTTDVSAAAADPAPRRTGGSPLSRLLAEILAYAARKG